MSSVPDRLTASLSDRYRLDRELGAGGMATVYLAHDLKHDRDVAIKVLHPDLGAALGGERFVSEIRTTARLQHPHILPLLDSGEADGLLYYVMPLVTGETLRARLEREKQLPINDAVRIAREVASALDYAHRQGVIHRDIKPENVLLHDGSALVADFGIALAAQSAGGARMTQTGLSLGTPQYMSPEQAMGERTIDARSDIYALGAMTYEMLAGDAPFTGSSVQAIVAKVINSEPERLTMLRKTVPPYIEAAVLTALAKLPADRYASAAEFSTALSTNRGATYAATYAATSAMAGVHANSPRAQRLTIAACAVATVATAAALWVWLTPAPPPLVMRDSIVLGDSTGANRVGNVGGEVALAPDGSAIVFVQGTGSTAQLYLKSREQLTATPVAGTAGVSGAPTFSPDGQWIAFVSRDGKLLNVPRSGGPAILLADSVQATYPSVAWLGSDTVVYAHRGGVSAVAKDGGTTRTMVPMQAAGSTLRNFAALPGGRSMLAIRCSAGCVTTALVAVELRAGTTKLLAEDVLAAWWLSDGIVAYARRDGEVVAAPFDVEALAFERTPIAVLSGVRGRALHADMAVSTSGMAVYLSGNGVSSFASDVTPVWVNRSGTATVIDSTWRVPSPTRRPLFGGRLLAISPDGDRVAVTVLREGNQSDVWIKQLARAPFTYTKLTFAGDNVNPVWLRDGGSLLFASGANKVPGYVFRKRSDGTGPADTLLSLPRGITEVLITPDSARFVLRVVSPPSRDIVQGQVGRGPAVPLLASPAYNEIAPALSPDGKWLAYSSDESGQFEVYVRPYPDVNSGRWQVSQAGGLQPVWSRNGRELFYQNGAKMLVSAAVLPGPTFTLGAQTPLFSTSAFASNDIAVNYDVSPDGQRFLFLRLPPTPTAEREAALVQITNWGAEVRAKLAGKVP
jgi:serine/threonine-protein kinase